MGISVNRPESFLWRHILGLRGICMKLSMKFFHWLRRRCDNREKSKMAEGGHICQWIQNKIGGAQLDHQGNLPDKFLKNMTSGLGRDAMRSLPTSGHRTVSLWNKLCSKDSTSEVFISLQMKLEEESHHISPCVSLTGQVHETSQKAQQDK